MAKLGDFKMRLIAEDQITPATKKARESTEKLSKSTGKLKTSLMGMGRVAKTYLPFIGGAAVIAGMGRLAKGILDTGIAFERMRFQLRGVSDTVAEADSQFNMIRDFAAKTPFMTENVTAAFIRLKAVGLEPTLKDMETMGNAAFTMGRDITDVSQSIVALETEVLRRLGIVLDRTGKKAVVVSGTMRVEVENSIDAIRRAVLDMWEKRFPGAMKKAEETTSGAVAIFKSEWAEFKDALAVGVLPAINDVMKALTRAAKAMKDFVLSGRVGTVQYLERQIGELRDRLKEVRGHLEKGTESVEQSMSALATYAGVERTTADSTKELSEEEEELVERLIILEAALARVKGQMDDYQGGVEGASGATGKLKKVAGEAAEKIREVWKRYGLTGAMLEKIVGENLEWNKELKKNAEAQEKIKNLLLSQIQSEEKLRELRESGEEQWNELVEKSIENTEKLNVDMGRRIQMHREIQEWGALGVQQMEEMVDPFEKVRETVDDLSKAFTDQLARGIADMVVEGKKFGDIMRGVFRSLLAAVVQYIAKLLIVAALEKAMGGFAGLFKGSAVGYEHHKGGVVKHGGGIVEGWARAHEGLRSDERPIIAQVGEGLLSRTGVARVGGAAGVEAINKGTAGGGVNLVINVNNETGTPIKGEQVGARFDGERFVVGVVLKNLQNSMVFRNAIAGVK